MGVSFMLHVMLSMGRFETEINLIMHQTIREYIQYCSLIGIRDDEDSLIEYAYSLTRNYIIEEVQYYSNSRRVVDLWVITATELFTELLLKMNSQYLKCPQFNCALLWLRKKKKF